MSTDTSYLTIKAQILLYMLELLVQKKNRQGMIQRIASMEDLHATIGKEQAIHTGKKKKLGTYPDNLVEFFYK